MNILFWNDLFCNVGELTCQGEGFDEVCGKELELIRSKIINLELERFNLGFLDLYDEGTVVEFDGDVIYHEEKRFRRVYLTNSEYFIGWVVDSDINSCMSCGSHFLFNWLGKHHCRACGNIVCTDCSPYVADVHPLNEPQGSKVCKSCFGEMLQHFDDVIRRPRTYSGLNFASIYAAVCSPKIRTEKFFVSKVETGDPIEEDEKPSQYKFPGVSPTYEMHPLKLNMKSNSLKREASITSLESSSESVELGNPDEPIFQHFENGNLNLNSLSIDNQDNNASKPKLLKFSPSFMTTKKVVKGGKTKKQLPVFSPKAAFNQSFSSLNSPKLSNELQSLILSGEAAKARSLLRLGCEPLSSNVATNLLMTSLDCIDDMDDVLGTYEILIELFHADINSYDPMTNDSPLLKVIRMNHCVLGDYFISRGADCLLMNEQGQCPLSVSFDRGIRWVLDSFVDYEESKLLSSSSDFDRIENYITCLIIAGYISKLLDLIATGRIHIGSEEAMELSEVCNKNYSKLREPEATFQFLHGLCSDLLDENYDQDYNNNDDDKDSYDMNHNTDVDDENRGQSDFFDPRELDHDDSHHRIESFAESNMKEINLAAKAGTPRTGTISPSTSVTSNLIFDFATDLISRANNALLASEPL